VSGEALGAICTLYHYQEKSAAKRQQERNRRQQIIVSRLAALEEATLNAELAARTGAARGSCAVSRQTIARNPHAPPVKGQSMSVGLQVNDFQHRVTINRIPNGLLVVHYAL
jgi:hypothetical protein